MGPLEIRPTALSKDAHGARRLAGLRHKQSASGAVARIDGRTPVAQGRRGEVNSQPDGSGLSPVRGRSTLQLLDERIALRHGARGDGSQAERACQCAGELQRVPLG